MAQPGFPCWCPIDVSKRPPRGKAGLYVALACVAVTGCGVAGPESRTLVGPVTVVSHDSVCIGGPDASGECFAKNWLTRNLRVSDCIRVTYEPDESAAYTTATRIEHLDAARHAADCPRQ